MSEQKDIKSMDLPELTEALTALGQPSFRAGQIFDWIHEKLAEDYDRMGNIPAALKDELKSKFDFTHLQLVKEQISGQDNTRKYLFELSDGNMVESVWMQYRHGNSVCISSQAGCRMGCRFCASALDGLKRSLAPSEMLEQVYAIRRITGERVSNIVVMGMGEPLDNYEGLLRFIRLAAHEKGLNISQRNITVSTCGLVPEIRCLAKEKLQITLAVSLHASSDEKRKKIMPIANKYSIEELLQACGYYFEKTGRRITFEYSLIRGVNDGEEDARELSLLLKPLNCHINLIPVNPVKERDFVESTQENIRRFKIKLEKDGINVTIRREMGRDIDGACGQLRQRYKEQMTLEV